MIRPEAPKELPAAGPAIGHGIREFKDSLTGGERADDGPELETPNR